MRLVLGGKIGPWVLRRRILLDVLRIGHVGLLDTERARTTAGFPSHPG
jgi:hypothetical protein